MTLNKRTEALSRVPLFAKLGRRSLERIARVAAELEAPAGQVLIEPGMKGSGMFVLLEGTVTIEARDMKARDAGPGECFGELALLTADALRTARVRAKTPVRCLAITRADFRRLLADDPRLSLAVLETVAARLAGQA